MRMSAFAVILAAAILLAGCGDAERLEAELATAQAKAAQLDSTLAQARAAVEKETARATRLERDLETARSARDSLEASLKSAVARSGQLKKKLHAARTRFEDALDSLRGANAALTLDIDRWAAQLQNSEVTIANLEQRANRFREQRDSVSAFMASVRPWYDYYKQESRRSWLKKLFAAGHAERPQIPEPDFAPAPPPEELEAIRP